MKNCKKSIRNLIICMIIVAITTSYTTPIYASESLPEHSDIAVPVDEYLEPNFDDSHEYFKFKESLQRMDDYGNFTFSCKVKVLSDSFIPAASTITVTTSAQSSDSDKKTYYVTLCKSGSEEEISTIRCTANGKSQSGTFSNLDTNERYCLIICPSAYYLGGVTITGSGKVIPIK